MSHTQPTLSFADDIRQASKGTMYEDEFETCCVQIDLVTKQRDDLLEVSAAVVRRWDEPSWKDVPKTAQYINALRNEIEAIEAAIESQTKGQ